MNKWLVSVSIATVLVTGGVQASGDAAAGKTKSATCAACHAADGNSVNPLWPKLAGQHPSYLKKQVMDFKSGSRKDATMTAMVIPLSDQDAADLAAYFATQKKTLGTAEEAKVALGEKIYRGGNTATGVAACMACHGPAGSGNPAANFPALSGQHAAYTEKTLKDFRSGARSNDAQKMMQGVVGRMTDEEIASVAQYIQGLQR